MAFSLVVLPTIALTCTVVGHGRCLALLPFQGIALSLRCRLVDGERLRVACRKVPLLLPGGVRAHVHVVCKAASAAPTHGYIAGRHCTRYPHLGRLLTASMCGG